MSEYTETILVTGGAGFIGSNYLNKYVPKSPKTLFVNVDALTYAGNLDNVTVSGEDNYMFVEADIRDRGALKRVFEEYKPTAVIHFAAESHVDLGLEDPNLFLETNVLGTGNLLSLANEYEVNRFHHISTDEVYGALNESDPAFTENDVLNPRNQYSASKAAAEMLVISYFETYGLNAVITRSCNTFGPNQDDSKLMPKFISLLQQDKPVTLYGEGAQMREWLYVEDCVDGIETVFRNAEPGSVYNLGGGKEMKNYNLTCLLLEAFGKSKDTHISYVEDRKGHDFRYSLDISKIQNDLQWEPKISFADGLKRTIESYE